MGILKKIFFPTGAKKSVDGLRSWTVRWLSYELRYGKLAYTNEEAEVFLSEEDAKEFVVQLKEAFKLTKSDVTDIKITENIQK